MKLETYVPLRYRKYFKKVVFSKGYFPPKYMPLENTIIIPSAVANNISNLLRIQGVNIEPYQLINGKYQVYVPYEDQERMVIIVTDPYGNMVGNPITMPKKALEYYSKKPSLPILV